MLEGVVAFWVEILRVFELTLVELGAYSFRFCSSGFFIWTCLLETSNGDYSIETYEAASFVSPPIHQDKRV